MNTKKFILGNAVRDLLEQKFLFFILIVNSVLSILSVLCAANMLWSKWQEYELVQDTDADTAIVAEFFLYNESEIHTETFVRNLLETNLKNKPEKMGFCSFMNMTVEWNDTASICNVQGNSREWAQLQKSLLLSGQGMEALEDGKHQCVIEEDGRLYKKGISVGDTVRINGEMFEVIGIVKYPLRYGDVFLSFSDFMQLAGFQRHQYQAVFQYEEEVKTAKVRPYLEMCTEYLTECCSGAEHQKLYADSLVKRQSERLLILFLLLLFAGINFIVIILEKQVFEQKKAGIRIAVGASFRMILLENAVKMELITSISFLLAKWMNTVFADLQIFGMCNILPLRINLYIWFAYSVLILGAESLATCLFVRKRSALCLLKDIL